jgi:hypothetical protein
MVFVLRTPTHIVYRGSEMNSTQREDGSGNERYRAHQSREGTLVTLCVRPAVRRAIGRDEEPTLLRLAPVSDGTHGLRWTQSLGRTTRRKTAMVTSCAQ